MRAIFLHIETLNIYNDQYLAVDALSRAKYAKIKSLYDDAGGGRAGCAKPRPFVHLLVPSLCAQCPVA
jgi:hypothetical protein